MKINVALSIIFFMSGCATAQNNIEPCDSWETIFHAPKNYSGKEVILQGTFSAEFEVCVLRSLDKKYELWVAPSDAEPTLCTFEQAVSRPIHQWAKIKGVFNYGASYGHLGTYSAAIANAQIVLVTPKNGKSLKATECNPQAGRPSPLGVFRSTQPAKQIRS